MSVTATIRAYERFDLPLEERLPSLARRFPCLKDAEGIFPWDPDKLHNWILGLDENNPAYQTGVLLLNLVEHPTPLRFDVLKAAVGWSEQDRQMFVDFMRIWKF